MGFFIWLIPFIASVMLYPLKVGANPLFESLMPVIISLVVVILAYYYLKNVDLDFIKEGLILGGSWFIISIGIDLLMFLPYSPMQMSLTNYMVDIGITYLIIPIITLGMSMIVTEKSRTR